MTDLTGKKVREIEKDFYGVEGTIIVHEKDAIMRDVIRLKITKGKTPITDYFLSDVEIMETE